LGRQAKKLNIKASGDELKKRGIPLYETERGGDVTYHGPGQLVVYPILNLDYFKRDIHLFLRRLEELAIQVLSDFGISGQRRPELTGVWVGDEKIVSIGIAIRNWITYHGLTLNIKKDDLPNFSLIRPCGMDIMMTSLESVLGKEVLIDSVKEILIRRLQNDKSSLAGIR
jgi:lipoate-protein ligase B